MISATIQNSVACATWRPGFVHFFVFTKQTS